MRRRRRSVRSPIVNIDDLVLVSVDDHVVEPRHLFEGRMPAKYRERAPRIVEKDEGTEAWVWEGMEAGYIGLNAVSGRPKDEYGTEPTRYDEMRPGCYDIHERVRDMDVAGVLASLNFPSFPQFCGQFFAQADDKDLALATVRAYNDWHVDEWCGTYPGRMMPLALSPFWDPQLMAGEVRRMAAKGCHAVAFSENPAALGLPSFHSDHWDPFWQTCCDEGTVVCLHIGSSSKVPMTAMDAPFDVLIALTPLNTVMCAGDLLFSPVLRKFPDLVVALSEGGIGWIPYFLERVDRVYDNHRAWTHQDFGGKLPSEVFHERIVTCFIHDSFGVESRKHLNLDLLTWECDYPHSDSSWPNAPESIAEYGNDLTDREVAKITHENALRIFSFDPFTVIPRQEATVGALRGRATDVDLGIRSSPRLKKSGDQIVTLTSSGRL
jgi:predicted TIM-barrel fold metal-dependent hydrolase